MKTRSIKTALFALALGLSLTSCQDKPQTFARQIDQLKQKVVADTMALHQLKTVDYQNLKSDFRFCDSLLQFMDTASVNAAFEKLNLTQAYLHQFGELQPVMNRKMRYLFTQLDLLKTDAESHYLSDSLAVAYLNDESRVADTLHHQIEYFNNRFGQCQKDLNAIKKNH